MGKQSEKYYQYNFEDVYGTEWKYHAVNPFLNKKQEPEMDGQINLEELYDKSVFGEETEEEYVRRKMSPLRRCRICTSTIMSGDYVEIDMYPVIGRKDLPRGKKKKTSRPAQKNLNNRNRIKTIVRLINTNFCRKDYIVHLTYEDGFLPTENRAKKDMQNFLAKIKRRRKKQGLPPLKYIYVTEFVPEGEKTRKVRVHHHLIMTGGLDRDEVESLWGKGRCQTCHAQPDDFELTGFAKYIGKQEQEKGRHSYSSSKNLDKPKVYKSVTKLSRRKFAEIIRAGDDVAEMLESLYRGQFKYLDSTTYISQEYGGFYLYSRLRRKVSVWKEKGGDGMEQNEQEENAPDKENALTGNILPCKAFLEYDWKGSLANGEATYSIVLEAVQRGEVKTAEYIGKITDTTKNRAELIIARESLSLLKPCRVEFHTRSSYFDAGITGNRFKRQQKEGYRNIKNADLIEKFLKAAEPYQVSCVKEDKNRYSDTMAKKRQQDQITSIERDR